MLQSASRCSGVSSGRIGVFFPASDIDDGNAEVRDGGALIAGADEQGQRATVEGVSEDEIGLEVVKRHLEARALSGDVASKEVDEIVTGHLHTGRLLHTLGVGLEEIAR